MFINFWYAAEWSKNLAEKPLKRQIIGQDFVLFRDEGGVAHCLANTCAHRGGSLGNGRVVDGDVECPYHGWRFKGDGVCSRIPAIGKSKKPISRARVDSYPVQEKYGLIFTFLGDLPEDERPPLMEVTQWDDPDYRFTFFDNTMQANYGLAMENGVDSSHTEFVHSPLMGFRGADRPNGEYLAPYGEILERGKWGGEMGAEYPPGAGWGKFRSTATKLLGLDKKFTGIHVDSAYWGPNSLDTSIYLSKTSNMHIPQYLWETPIDENTTRMFLVGGRNFMMSPLFDRFDRSRNIKIAQQDAAILENVKPGRPPESPTDVLFVKPDGILAHLEASRKKWEAMGWRIDLQKIREHPPGQKQFVIPSPGRRQSGQWVYDTVPLLPPKPLVVTTSSQAS
jgi:phenylpropionate dioxygenase-like ring-hydroxylating dioxygenase large terminal subunit